MKSGFGRIRAVAALVLMACLATAAPAAESKRTYFAVFLGDIKVGSMRRLRAVDGDRVVRQELTVLDIRRRDEPFAVREDVRSVESLDGQPLAFSKLEETGSQRVVYRGDVKDGQLTLSVDEGDGPRTKTIPWPTGALLPEGARLARLAFGLEKGVRHRLVLFRSDGAGALLSDRVLDAPLLLRSPGLREVVVPARTVTGEPETDDLWCIDRHGELLRFTRPFGSDRLVFVACDKAYAQSPNGRFELLSQSAAQSPRSLAGVEPQAALVYTLRLKSGGKAMSADELPESTMQRVRPTSDGARVEVRPMRSAPSGAVRPYAGADEEARRMLRPSPFVESDNDAVARIASKLAAGRPDAVAVAVDIAAWVGGYIEHKTSGIGYAGAVETLRRRAGDCSEHAVLTAALCRAAGIPCRVVVGLSYVQRMGDLSDCFIGHAWNQVYLGGKWVDLDAALALDGRRIALGSGDGDLAGLIGAISRFNQMEIEAIDLRE